MAFLNMAVHMVTCGVCSVFIHGSAGKVDNASFPWLKPESIKDVSTELAGSKSVERLFDSDPDDSDGG
jgi:hypothetical protein